MLVLKNDVHKFLPKQQLREAQKYNNHHPKYRGSSLTLPKSKIVFNGESLYLPKSKYVYQEDECDGGSFTALGSLLLPLLSNPQTYTTALQLINSGIDVIGKIPDTFQKIKKAITGKGIIDEKLIEEAASIAKSTNNIADDVKKLIQKFKGNGMTDEFAKELEQHLLNNPYTHGEGFQIINPSKQSSK